MQTLRNPVASWAWLLVAGAAAAALLGGCADKPSCSSCAVVGDKYVHEVESTSLEITWDLPDGTAVSFNAANTTAPTGLEALDVIALPAADGVFQALRRDSAAADGYAGCTIGGTPTSAFTGYDALEFKLFDSDGGVSSATVYVCMVLDSEDPCGADANPCGAAACRSAEQEFSEEDIATCLCDNWKLASSDNSCALEPCDNPFTEPCDPPAVCAVEKAADGAVLGAPSCVCPPGHLLDATGYACVDEAEGCSASTVCPANSSCAGAPSTCVCDGGFVDATAGLDPKLPNCVPGCGTKSCHPHAKCAGTDSCVCNPGYFGDGEACAPGPCATDNGGCDPNAVCTSTGSTTHTCECTGFFEGDGQVCQIRPSTITVGGSCNLEAAYEAAVNDSAGGGCTAGTGPWDIISVPAGDHVLFEWPVVTDGVALVGADPATTLVGLSKNGGSGLEVGPGGSLLVSGLTMERSSLSVPDAGGIINSAGDVWIHDASLESAKATQGGAIFMHGADATLTITGGSAFDGNQALVGGAIAIDGGSLRIDDAEFVDNVATDAGGAIYLLGAPGLRSTVSDVTFDGDATSGRGAALYLGGGVLEVTSASFEDHDATLSAYGGAQLVDAASEVVYATGGATFLGLEDVKIEHSSGGAVTVTGGASALVTASALIDNARVADGASWTNTGGAEVFVDFDSSLQARNSTFRGYQVFRNYGQLTLDFCTVVGQPEAVDYSYGDLISTNSIIQGGCDEYSEISVMGNNVLHALDEQCLVEGPDANWMPDDPLLGAFASDTTGSGGGSSYPLGGGSPAIDATQCAMGNGDTLTADQAGAARPSGGACDLGAREL